jgi:hypothetical protein
VTRQSLEYTSTLGILESRDVSQRLEASALLRCYTAYIGSCWTALRKTYRFHLQVTAGLLKMGPIGCPETSVQTINVRCIKSLKSKSSSTARWKSEISQFSSSPTFKIINAATLSFHELGFIHDKQVRNINESNWKCILVFVFNILLCTCGYPWGFWVAVRTAFVARTGLHLICVMDESF